MNNDREFASLLFDKAIENRIITDQLEIATIKKSLKMYSDCFVEDENWDAGAREKMKDEILSYIESIGALQVKLLASIEGGLWFSGYAFALDLYLINLGIINIHFLK